MHLLKRLQAAVAAFKTGPVPAPAPRLDEAQAPPPCDTELFHNGETIAIAHGACSEAIEALIRRVRREGEGKFQIDWHYAGGRARIMALGDIDVARAALAAKGELRISYYDGAEQVDSFDCLVKARRP